MSEDSGGAVMGRGGRSADPQRLASFLASTRDWGKEQDGPLEADQFESEGEPVDDESQWMIMASKGMMCALMASSFCERINSCAVEVVDERNTLLSQDEIDKVTVLRMNKEFMEFMRKEYPEVMTLSTSHRAYGTVVTMDQTKEDKVESEGIEVQPNEIDMG